MNGARASRDVSELSGSILISSILTMFKHRLAKCPYRFLIVKMLLSPFNKERVLVGAFSVSGHCEIREVSALIVRVELRWWPGPRHAVTMEIKNIKITRGSCNIKIPKEY